MKQTLALVVLAAVIIGITNGALTLSAQAKVRVCHKEVTGKGHVIVISENAWRAHIAHGHGGVAGWQKAGEPCQLPVLR